MTEATRGEIGRPTTSARDHDVLRDRLQSWLGDRLPRDAEPSIEAFTVPERNGMSSETLLFDLVSHGAQGPETTACVARLEPEQTAVPVFPTYDLEKQARVMRVVAASTDVPVPKVLWVEPDAGAVGSPFFIMERIDGVVPPDVMPYNFGDSWLFDAVPDEQRRLQAASVAVLADLHRMGAADVAFLERDRPEPTALGRHVAEQRAYYEWVAGDRPHPLLERCFAWLTDHWPADEGDPVLSWGDSRIGNVMYRDFVPVAVLDWEMAAVGPRELDLAWMIYLHRFFEDLAHQMELPGMPHFMRRDEVAETYERLTGHVVRNLDFHVMYAALRHGIVMSRVTQRSIHFGEAELPDDPDDLIMHRASLEEMLAGTYWDTRP